MALPEFSLIVFVYSSEHFRSLKYLCKHWSIESPRIGIAERWMVGPEQVHPVGEQVLRPVAESIGRAPSNGAPSEKMSEVTIPCNLPKANNNLHCGQRRDLGGEIRGAIANFFRRRFVTGRCTAHDTSNPCATQLESIVPMDRCWLTRQSDVMEDRIHEITRAVAGKNSPSAICTMCSWGEPQNEDSCPGIAKTRNRSSPILLVLVSVPLGFAYRLTVRSKPSTLLAVEDCSFDHLKRLRHFFLT